MLKIAVPTRDGMVDEHFGHCQSFTVFVVDENKTITGEESFTPPPSCGCKSNLIPSLVEKGVTALVGGNMGEGAVTRLGQAGIRVTRGASGPVRAAAEAWLAGKLKDAQIVCHSHGDHECGHHH